MSAVIESVATSRAPHAPLRRGARQLADQAIERALARAGRRAAELDLLVNAGIYRGDNLAEPALAALIQEDVGANPGHPPEPGAHGTFSFDVSNGGAGALTATEIVAGFLDSGSIALGLVVASDSNPGGVEEFPFPAVGGAMLLRPGEGGRGFVAFASETFPEHAGEWVSAVSWRARPRTLPFQRGGENVLSVRVSPELAGRAASLADRAARRFLEAQGLAPSDVDLLVASAYPPAFARELESLLGLPPGTAASPVAEHAGAHTAGILAALEPVFTSGRLASSRNALFVAVGAGITVASALYRARG